MKRSVAQRRTSKRALQPLAGLRRLPPAPIAPASDDRSMAELAHELQVHQIELEMQNEQLRTAQIALETARDRYVDLYDFAPIGYLSVGRDGEITEANLTAAGLLGIDRAKLVRSRFANHVAPGDRRRWTDWAQTLARDGQPGRIELVMCTGAQQDFHARIDGTRVDGPTAPPLLRITLINIDEHKRTEAELRLAAAAFETQEGIMITTADGVIERVNQAFTQMTGYSAEEAIGQRGSLMRSGRQDDGYYRSMWDTLQRTGRWQGELWNRRKSGEVYPQWLTITAVYDDAQAVTRYVGTMTDISDRKAREDEVAQLAFCDPLTNLPNRRLMKDRLQQALASSARTQREGVLMFVDVDHFKTVNDTIGHDRGDLLLQQIARRLVACVREGDTVARLGGDEFVVMLPSVPGDTPTEAAAQAQSIGEKILDALCRPYDILGVELHSSVSIGITLFSQPGPTIDELLQHADQAMYRAKAAGRNALRFFDASMQDSLPVRSSLESDLRHALRQGDLVLHYQPVVDLDRHLVGAEALLRFRHPLRGLVLPEEFISVAEEAGLIDALGRWVLESACERLRRWAADPALAGLTLAVNVCAHQIRAPGFVAEVMSIVERHGVDPTRLKLELTESVLLHDIDDTVAKMVQLKACGVVFSLDDFGTGYSSLSYLRRLPLDQLKADRSFVHEMLTHAQDAAIVRTIIDLGRNLGLTVLAEGVETEAQCELLTRYGCQGFQGHLFGPPMPIDDLEELARQAVAGCARSASAAESAGLASRHDTGDSTA